MSEIFKYIDEFPTYKIGTYGTVVNQNNKIMKPWLKSGYNKITLTINNKQYNRFIHRLVAIAFIDNNTNLPFINHIDGNKNNNSVDNLEWCTHKENMYHAANVLHSMDYLKVKPIARKLTVEQVKLIKHKILYMNKIKGTQEYYDIIKQFAIDYNVNQQTIKCIIWGKTWKDT